MPRVPLILTRRKAKGAKRRRRKLAAIEYWRRVDEATWNFIAHDSRRRAPESKKTWRMFFRAEIVQNNGRRRLARPDYAECFVCQKLFRRIILTPLTKRPS